MNNIKLLDDGMINKIAAGEVVERPASVVKELVENSIDAAASAVTVEIKEGGVSYMRVTDNGSGIPKGEVRTAFLRHATSKIRDMEDLRNVMSLGFRGEALSSVASVARAEMLTKTIGQSAGCRIEIEGGVVKSFTDAGCADGTSVVVRDLFFNTPARLKFLKKPAAEAAAVSEVMNRLALMHPEVSFKYIANSQTLLQTNGRDLLTAILYVYGKETAGNLIAVSYNNGGTAVDGYVGKPETARGNRSREHFYINGRYIKSELANAAVESVYKTRLPVGKFPFFVLHAAMPPSDVDVNVHPAKLEARFVDEEAAYACIHEAVSAALGDADLIPEIVVYGKTNAARAAVAEAAHRPDAARRTDENEKMSGVVYGCGAGRTDSPAFPDKKRPAVRQTEINIEPDRPAVPEQKSASAAGPETAARGEWPLNSCRVAGQLFETYWIFESGDSFYLLDQHAAHERITYERLLDAFRNSKCVTQRLVEPAALDLTRAEAAILSENMEMFERFGFEIEGIGDNKYALRGVPFVFDMTAGGGFLIQILDMMGSAATKIGDIYETKLEAIARFSCKASVKGNERIGAAEAMALCDELSRAKNPYTCPHGRPTVIEITRRELERRFKRA